VYVFVIKKEPETENLISTSSANTELSNVAVLNQNSLITKDLLSILLSVKNIKLDDSIFNNDAFTNLHDSAILITSSGDEGRLNPFAPIGFEVVAPAPIVTPVVEPIIQPSVIPTTTTSTPAIKTPTKGTKTP